MSFGSKSSGSSTPKAPPNTTYDLAPTHNEIAAKNAAQQRVDSNPASMALLSDAEVEAQQRKPQTLIG